MSKILTLKDYALAASRTDDQDRGKNLAATNWIWGMREELGEVNSHFKRLLFSGKPIKKEEFILECGDFMWYYAAWCRLTHVDLVSIGDHAIAPEPLSDIPDLAILKTVFRDLSKRVYDLDVRSHIVHTRHWHTNGCIEGDPYADYVERYGQETESCIFTSAGILFACGGVSMVEVMQANIDKLYERHPDGFSGYGVQYDEK